MKKALPLEALEQAIQEAKDTLVDLTHHCDHDSQYTNIADNEKLADYGITASGTVGDSYDNILAAAVNGLYTAKLIYSQPLASLAEVAFAMLNWVHRWNNERLHKSLDYCTPAKIIDRYNQTRVSELTST